MSKEKEKQDKYSESREFLNHVKNSGVDIAEVMQDFAELYHHKKGQELPKRIITKEELKESYKHNLTVGELKNILNKTTLPDNGKVMIQRIEDSYYENNNWGVLLKEGEFYYNAMSMNKSMREEIARRERGEEPKYPQMEDPSKFITPEDDETLNELKEQYHPAWCVVGYQDEEHLFIELHY